MGAKRWALDLLGLVYAENTDQHHAGGDDEAQHHQAVEGQGPVKSAIVLFPVHANSNDKRGSESTSHSDYRKLRLHLAAALQRLLLRVLQEQALPSHAAELHAHD